MHNPDFLNAHQLVDFSSKNKQYHLLLEQLEKDFNFAGVSLNIRKNCSPNNLVDLLNLTIKNLILNDFSGYLNLLYRINVSEKEIKSIDGSDLNFLAQQVCFLILKREWQKVWMRSHTAS